MVAVVLLSLTPLLLISLCPSFPLSLPLPCSLALSLSGSPAVKSEPRYNQLLLRQSSCATRACFSSLLAVTFHFFWSFSSSSPSFPFLFVTLFLLCRVPSQVICVILFFCCRSARVNVRVEEKVSVSSRPARPQHCVFVSACWVRVFVKREREREITEAVLCVLRLCVYMWRNTGGTLSWVRSQVCTSLSLSLSVHVCLCALITSAWLGSGRQARGREGEGEQYERGRAVLACGPGAGCCRLVAVLRWWPWSGPPSRKWWSSYTGSRGWPSPRRATRNSARYVDPWREKERGWRVSGFLFLSFSFTELDGNLFLSCSSVYFYIFCACLGTLHSWKAFVLVHQHQSFCFTSFFCSLSSQSSPCLLFLIFSCSFFTSHLFVSLSRCLLIFCHLKDWASYI